MGYAAQDENLFDKKIKVTLDRYDNLRNDYNEIIKNYNGVNLIVNNPTASAYPYLNEKIGDSSIPKEYRDRKYLSFINESEVDKEFNGGESGSFDITKGFYKIVLIGGGSGGIAYGSTDKCGSRSGNNGAVLIVYVYFPSNGTIKYNVGLGSHGLLLWGGGIDHYGSDAGKDTEIYFNDILVAKACGGEKSTVFRRTKSKITIDDSNGGKYVIGSFVKRVEVSLNGTNGWGEGMGNTREHTIGPTYDVSPYNQYGIGGKAQALMSPPYGYVSDGTNGYLTIESTVSTDDGFLYEGINVESRKIHTLGNENEIRRKIDNALQKIYKRLYVYGSLLEDRCGLIGEETDENTSCEPYSEDVITNRPYNLSEVITTNKNGSINEDGTRKEDRYIITYDWNTKRKIKLSNYKKYLENETVSDVYTGFIYNNDIIYIKNIPEESAIVDVYKFIDNEGFIKQPSQGDFKRFKSVEWNSLNNNISYDLTLLDECNITVSLTGAGGGAGGTSNHKRWKTSGGVGGSGGYIKAIIKGFKGEQLNISVGKGGTSGIGYKQGGETGKTGVPSILKINNINTVVANGGSGGEGSRKHGGNSGYSGNGGECYIDNERIITLISNIRGNGTTIRDEYGNVTFTETVDDKDKGIYRTGNPSVSFDGNYGGGAPALLPDYGGEGSRSIAAQDGYGEMLINYKPTLTYNGNVYEIYNGNVISSNIITWSDYLYDLEKLNRLKEYVSYFDKWFDNDGYCQRSCQINCQTKVQKS